VIAAMHAAFQMFHNRAVEEVRETTPGLTDADTFERPASRPSGTTSG